MSNITLYKDTGWIDTIKGLDSFGIVPEIRAQGTISKGYSLPNKPVSLDYFLVHMEPEPVQNTKTLPEILSTYGVSQPELKMLCVSIPSPDLCIKTGRFKYGKKSGVLCSSDDNVSGRPLMDLKTGKIILHQGADQPCAECPFHADKTCKETVLILFTILALTDNESAPYGNMLFKMTLPRTARNPFFGNYALAMAEAHNTVLRYGLDHVHFPQSMIPFRLSLVKRNGQYFSEEKQSQVKTSYYVPQLNLDTKRLHSRLARFAEQFGGQQLGPVQEQKAISGKKENPEEKPSITQQGFEAALQRLRGYDKAMAEKWESVNRQKWTAAQWAEALGKINQQLIDLMAGNVGTEAEPLDEEAEKEAVRKAIIAEWDTQDYVRPHRVSSLRLHLPLAYISGIPEEMLTEVSDIAALNDYLEHLQSEKQ